MKSRSSFVRFTDSTSWHQRPPFCNDLQRRSHGTMGDAAARRWISKIVSLQLGVKEKDVDDAMSKEVDKLLSSVKGLPRISFGFNST